ncbi:MAG: hypothetical protein EOO96_29375 [Pedobacter sp.]|nr:MAG: hypothetical protein EOO96_29375 [Pedobacter sp.]
MLRKGKITSFNEDGSGMITDENDQEIPFLTGEIVSKTINGSSVSFKIELSKGGLVAVDVEVTD